MNLSFSTRIAPFLAWISTLAFLCGSAFAQVAAVMEYDPSDPVPEGDSRLEEFNFVDGGQWTTTATDGAVAGGRGTPVTLTWAFVADGTTIAANSGLPEVAGPSDLLSFLDTELPAFAPVGTGTDLTTRSWYPQFSGAFDRLSALAGLTFVYTTADSGADIDSTSAPVGSLGIDADIRIGGHSIDGQIGANTLAYNFFPNHGDMVIDTDNTTFFNGASVGFRNTLMHEVGHGLGLGHVWPAPPTAGSGTKLMEPFIATAFEGPQIDDILGLHRGYGDVNEKMGGNDTFGTATSLGAPLNLFQPAAVGVDAIKHTGGASASAQSALALALDGVGEHGGPDTSVAITDTDFVSIDGISDDDYYSFVISTPTAVSLTLTPLGPTYDVGTSIGSVASFDSSAQLDLELELFDTDGTTSLFTATATGLGGVEVITSGVLPGGTYYARVGDQSVLPAGDTVQLYSLVGLAVPEPSVAGLLALGGLALVVRRRR